MYRRILLAYDGSQEALVALREGALLARRCRAHVFLLSVIPELPGVKLAEGMSGTVISHQIEKYEALLARGVEVLGRLGLSPIARLVIGEPALEIGAFATEIGADLVVLAHRRQNLLQRWWSGATGAYVCDNVNCSVLIGRNTVSDEQFEAELRTNSRLTQAVDSGR
jgi:nucleotide-binding universal stress UspA family protein